MIRQERDKLIDLLKQARELTFQLSDLLFKAKSAEQARKPNEIPSVKTAQEQAEQLASLTLKIKNHLSNEKTLGAS